LKRTILVGLACLAAAGCASKKTDTVDVLAMTRDPSCYTVDLFGKVPWKTPEAAVPDAKKAFAGRWGGGKWDGVWCHDLYVLDVRPDGAAQIIETYAPHAPWGKRAAAFTRRATIDRDGRLRVAYGNIQMEYWIENGELYGLRDEGGVTRKIILTRQPT
jgi:hypothetical protein